jgi:hypothetical protein
MANSFSSLQVAEDYSDADDGILSLRFSSSALQ